MLFPTQVFGALLDNGVYKQMLASHGLPVTLQVYDFCHLPVTVLRRACDNASVVVAIESQVVEIGR